LILVGIVWSQVAVYVLGISRGYVVLVFILCVGVVAQGLVCSVCGFLSIGILPSCVLTDGLICVFLTQHFKCYLS